MTNGTITGVERINDIAQQLEEGKSPQPITVREFLAWFSAQRRGYSIVSSIREILTRNNVRTLPDFESAYIDSQISFALDGVAASQASLEQVGTTPASASATAELSTSHQYNDPTYRISKLAAANNTPISVKPDATLSEAVTLMLANDFSQLPVMTGDREVKGVISWISIGTRLALGRNGVHTREFMDQPVEIKVDASLFQAIPIIVQHQYVLVRSFDNRITGIVTASDLSLQFKQLAEPFLLLSEIENHIRRLIENKFDADELSQSGNPSDADRKIERVADMTFGEYIRLLEKPDRWSKLKLPIDRTTFCKQLDQVRSIRNDVMHFDPDGIPREDLEVLRKFTDFLQRLQGIGVS